MHRSLCLYFNEHGRARLSNQAGLLRAQALYSTVDRGIPGLSEIKKIKNKCRIVNFFFLSDMILAHWRNRQL